MATYEVSRTLVKSPPELWAELTGDRLSEAVGDVSVNATEPERELRWVGQGVTGTARLEPSSWGTKVTLTAEVEEQVADLGFWARIRGVEPPPPRHAGLERRLENLLDGLGSAHRKPFVHE
jgi:class 3 adenylate cyclase